MQKHLKFNSTDSGFSMSSSNWRVVHDKEFPAPHTPNNRVLLMITAGRIETRVESLLIIFNECQAMCESGFSPKIVLFTFTTPTNVLQDFLQSKTFCYRTNQLLPIEYQIQDISVGYHLPDATRPYAAQVLNDFDVFVYLEDDMIFKNTHLIAYLHETKQLEKKMAVEAQWTPSEIKLKLQQAPTSGYQDNKDYIIGFHRISQYRKDKARQREAESDLRIIQNERFIEQPAYQPICIGDAPYIKSGSHQAVWILTKHQIVALQDKCQFLNQNSSTQSLPREYMSSFSLFNYPGHGGCDLTKVFPVKNYLHFNILHYFDGFVEQPLKIRASAYEAAGNVSHGLLTRKDKVLGLMAIKYPDCWHDFIKQNNPSWINNGSTASQTVDVPLPKVEFTQSVNVPTPKVEFKFKVAPKEEFKIVPKEEFKVKLPTKRTTVHKIEFNLPNTNSHTATFANEQNELQNISATSAKGIEMTQLVMMIVIFILVSIYRYRNNIRRLIVGSEFA